jgi:hypothetical protein
MENVVLNYEAFMKPSVCYAFMRFFVICSAPFSECA